MPLTLTVNQVHGSLQ